MIIESLVKFAVLVLGGLIDTLSVFSLPLDGISVIADILKYGNWIVGSDLMLLFVGCVTFWWSVRLSLGIVIWVWRMLPLT